MNRERIADLMEIEIDTRWHKQTGGSLSSADYLAIADRIIAEEGKPYGKLCDECIANGELKPQQPKADEGKCNEKPYTLSHGIGLSGKVEELIITLPKQPQQPKLPERLDTVIIRVKQRVGERLELCHENRLAINEILDYLKAKE